MRERPNIFKYQDYRMFLSDMFNYLKKTVPGYSHRAFSKHAGFKSPNFLKLLISGKRNVSIESVPKIGVGLQLAPKEVIFLSKLIEFNQESNYTKKSKLFMQLFHATSFQRAYRVQGVQYKYYSKWWHTVIREMVTLKGFKEDHQWISHMLRGEVTPRQVKSSISLLLKLNFLVRDDQGFLKQTHPTIESGEEISSMYIKVFHREMLQRAEKSLKALDASQRDISSICLGMPAKLLPELKARIIAFRKELLNTIGNSTEPSDTIVQLNIQLMKHTETLEGKE